MTTPTTITALPPHRPAKLADCRDRREREVTLATALDGRATWPARTPIAHRHDDGIHLTAGCPATDHGPCLCGLLGRAW